MAYMPIRIYKEMQVEMQVVNLKQLSLKSRRIVHDYMISNDKNIHNMEISSELALSCKALLSRYVSYMKSNAEKMWLIQREESENCWKMNSTR